jgi:hypothetical protein
MDIGRREAQDTAAGLSRDDATFDLVRPSEELGGLFDVPFGEFMPDQAGADDLAGLFNGRHPVDAEAELSAQPGELGNVAPSVLAESEVLADHDFPGVKTVLEHVPGKGAARETPDSAAEWDHNDPFDAGPTETLQALAERLDERDVPLVRRSRRMGKECQDQRKESFLCSQLKDALEDLPVAEMNSVEIAYGDDGTPGKGRHFLEPVEDLHGFRLSRR